MMQFTEDEKGYLFNLLESIAQTNQQIVSYLTIATTDIVKAAFDQAFKDDLERRVYETVNGEMGARKIAEVLGDTEKKVRTRIEHLAKNGFIEQVGGRGEFQRALSKVEIVQAFSKPSEEQQNA